MSLRHYLALLAPLFLQKEACLSIKDLFTAKMTHPGGSFVDAGDTVAQNAT